MEEHFINVNPNRQYDYVRHAFLDQAKSEAVRLMKTTGDNIYVYKLVGVVKPVPDHIFEEPIIPVPF